MASAMKDGYDSDIPSAPSSMESETCSGSPQPMQNKNASSPPPSPPFEISTRYKIRHRLGDGSQGSVFAATCLATGRDVAIKEVVVPSGAREKKMVKNLQLEVGALHEADHKNVLGLLDTFAVAGGSPDVFGTFYIVTKMARGGNLLGHVEKGGRYAEEDARMVMLQLCSGLQHLHRRCIIHRDIKLENILVDSASSRTRGIKIADLGMCRRTETRGQQVISTGVAGSPLYIQPEQLAMGREVVYDERADIWSLGILLYIILSGVAPFTGSSTEKTFECVRSGAFDFGVGFGGVSGAAKDLITRMLVVDPAKRLRIEGVLAHPWLQQL